MKMEKRSSEPPEEDQRQPPDRKRLALARMYPYRGQTSNPNRGRGGGGRGRGLNDSNNRIISQTNEKKLVNMTSGGISRDPSYPNYEKFKKYLEEQSSNTAAQASSYACANNEKFKKYLEKQSSNTAAQASSYAWANNEKFNKYLEKQSSKTTAQASSYSCALAENDKIDSYESHSYEEVILILEDDDKQWIDDPWYLMQRYLDTDMYPLLHHKQRQYFEHILQVTESCEFDHFKSNTQASSFTSSKIHIKKIISSKEWGLSTLKVLTGDNTRYQFNYWDYVEAFHKVFLYENPMRKHSWLIEFNPEIFTKKRYPNWIHSWWTIFGPSIKILPEPYNGLFTEWLSVTPHSGNNANDHIEGSNSLIFFMEFGVPWMWKWIPTTGKNKQNIPCLKRTFYSKFWSKLLKIDKETNQSFGQPMIEKIAAVVNHYKSKAEESKLKEEESESPFSQIFRKIQTKKPMSSKDEIMSSYLDEVKKDFLKHFESQDLNEEATTEDYWNSLKEILVNKVKQEKGSTNQTAEG